MATNISDQEPVLVLNDKKYIISELEPQAQYCVGQMNFIQGNILFNSTILHPVNLSLVNY